jgi:catechol 2,3-dioxygenase-like lactoylglutathione lyase family enzyme
LKKRPLRLHHHAYTTADHEINRHFYEDILGLPLKAMWIEREQIDGEVVDLGHAFYELGDGSSLAFFNFADPAKQQAWQAMQQSLFVHISLLVDKSTQDEIEQRLAAAGLALFNMDHGFCQSLYIRDPCGLMLEFTVDHVDAQKIYETRAATAHRDLKHWINGGREMNNAWRPNS